MTVDESYITFHLDGQTEAALKRLTGSERWVHVRDPGSVVEDRLRRLGEVLARRDPGYEFEARGLFLELLGVLQSSVRVGPRLRHVRRSRAADAPTTWQRL